MNSKDNAGKEKASTYYDTFVEELPNVCNEEAPVGETLIERQDRLDRDFKEALSHYIRTSLPDKDELAELVIKAKGPARSMKQFAEEIGSTSSTLSRIVNKQTRGTNSDTLIADIAAHADPESGVTFDELMKAHGMTTIDRTKWGDTQAFENSVKRIILTELYERKYLMMDSENKPLAGVCFEQKFDFVITTNALREDGSNAEWAFKILYLPPYPVKSGPGSFITFRNSIMRLLGALYTSGNPYNKISLVIADQEAFKDIKSRPWSISLKDEISVILVDLDKTCFVEEFTFPCDSDNRKEVFYKKLEIYDGT